MDDTHCGGTLYPQSVLVNSREVAFSAICDAASKKVSLGRYININQSQTERARNNLMECFQNFFSQIKTNKRITKIITKINNKKI